MAGARVLYDVIARDNASRTFQRVGDSAARLESRASKVGAAISKGLKVGTVAVAGIGAVSLKSAVDFQSAMTRISTQAGGTQKDVKVLGDQVLKLGGKVQQAPQQLAEALYHLKSVGMDNVDAMKALRTASDLAAVGGSDLEETTNALAGAWRTGIKGATSFGEAAATVNAIIGAGNMTLGQFTEALSSGILPTAKTFGLTLKQVGAALALFTDEGVPAADAATRLRMSISLLGAPSAAAEKQLKKIGLTGLDLAKAMRSKDGIIGAIQLLKDHLDASGLSAAQQSQLLSRAFGGGRSSAGILALINNLDVLKQKQNQVNKSTGKYADAVKQQRKTAEAEWKRLQSALESGSVRLGTVLLPPITGFVTFLNDKALPAFGKVGRTLGSLVPVGKIKTDISEVETIVSDFLTGLTGGKGVGGALDDLLKGLTGKPAGFKLPKPTPPKNLPPSVIAHGFSPSGLTPRNPLPANLPPSAVAHGVGNNPNVSGGMATVFPSSLPPSAIAHGIGVNPNIAPFKPKKPLSAAQKLGETIRKAVSGGIEGIDWGKLGANLGKGLGTAFQWIAAHGAELSKKLGEALAGIDWVNVGKQLGGVAIPFAIGFIDNLFEPLFHKDFWRKHTLDTILAVVSVVPFGKVFGVVGKLLKFGSGTIAKVLDRIPWSKLIPFGKKLAEAIGPLAVKASEFVGKLALKFGEAFARRFPKVAEWFGRELELLPTRLGYIGLELVKKGGQLIKKLGDVLVDKVPGMGNRFIRAALKVLGRFTLYQIGVNLAKSLISGAWSVLKDIGSWMKKHLVDRVVGWVKSGFGIASPSKVFTSIGGNLIAGLKNGVIGAAKGIGRWITDHVISPVTGRFKNAGSWLKSKGGALVSGLKAGIVDAMRGIGRWLKDSVVDPVVGAVKHYFGIKSPSRVFMSIGGHLVSGLIKGMSRTSGAAIAHKIFGSMPKALASIVKKGLVSVASLPGKALKALGGLGGDLLGLLGLGGGGSGSSANQQIGKLLAATQGWSGPQWTALQALWTGESGWNEKALNASSGAYGIPQALPASKMASAGSDWKTNPSTQIKWGLGYIKSRYGDPLSAYSAWLSRSPHWYDQGGLAKGTGYMAKNTLKPERVLSPRQTAAFDRLVDLLERGVTGGGGGRFEGQLVLDSGELMGVIKGSVKPMIRQSEDRQAYRAKVGRR